MRSDFLTITFLFLSCFLHAQIPVGHYMDTQGMPIVGYFDPLEYWNNEPAIIDTRSRSTGFGTGYYYDQKGEKIEALLLEQSDHVEIAQPEGYETVSLMPDEVKSFIIDEDSFFTVSNFYIDKINEYNGNVKRKKFKNKPRYVRFITEFNGFEFACYTEYDVFGAHEYYIGRKMGSTDWFSISKKPSELDDILNTLFEGLQTNDLYSTYDTDWIKSIIYAIKEKEEIPIYFNELWQEVADKNQARYRGELKYTRGIWKAKFFNDTVLVNESTYSSLIRQSRDGESKWYYPSGMIRKLNKYDKNRLLYTSHYFENGQLHYGIKWDIQFPLELDNFRFVEVYNTNGDPVLDVNGNGVETFRDEIQNRVITRHYEEGKIVKSYFERTGDIIYQYINKKERSHLDLYGLKSNWKDRVIDQWRSKYSKSKKSAVYLFSLNIDGKGELKSMNGFHLVDGLLDTNMVVQGLKPVKLQRMKVNGENVDYEIVVPFQINNIDEAELTNAIWIRNYHWHKWISIQEELEKQDVMRPLPSMKNG